MSWKELSRANFTIHAITSILEEEGFDPNVCLVDTGLKTTELLDVQTKISPEIEIQIIERALSVLPKKAGYGFRVGRSLRITNFGVWGLAILTSPDMRSAIEAMARFSEFSLTLSKVSFRESQERMAFVLDMRHLPSSIHRFMFERYCSMTVNFLAEMIPDYQFSDFELHLPFSDPAYESELAKITGLEVLSNQAEFSLSVLKELLDVPFPEADPLAHAHFIAECERMLKGIERLPDYAQRIRNYILREKDFSPSLETVAKSMCLSGRTLRRRLQEEEHNFNQVVLDTKMALAKELLQTTSLPVKVVAERLNYSESASFVRAFKKWSGQSPAKLKQSV